MPPSIGTITGDPNAKAVLKAALRRRLRAFLANQQRSQEGEMAQGALGIGQLIAFMRQNRKRLPGDEMSQGERDAHRARAMARVLRGVHGPYQRPIDAPGPVMREGLVKLGGQGYQIGGQDIYAEPEPLTPEMLDKDMINGKPWDEGFWD